MRSQTPTGSAPGALRRGDLAIHALAQAPDHVELELASDEPALQALGLLARAYGIGDRVHLCPTTAPRRHGGGASFSPAGRTATVPRAGSFAELVESLYAAGDGPASLRHGDDALAGQRVVIVTNRPTHYRVPLFNRLAERLAAAGGSLCVLFTSDLNAKPWMRPESLRFAHVELAARGLPRGAGTEIPADLGRRLRQARPTLLLAGSLSPQVGGRVAHFAHRRGLPFGVWSGEIHPSPTSAGRLRTLQRRWILRRCTFAIAYGHRAGEYLRGVAPTVPVVIGRNTSPFVAPPDRSRRNGPVELLAVSQAIPRKRLDLAIDAVGRLDGASCRLTVIGSGARLDALRAQARGHSNIDVRGLVESDLVADAYRRADVFLFPSGFDPFGLVLVEALGCALPAVVAAEPGAVADLAVSRRNCIVVDDATPRRWAEALRELVARPQLRRSLGAAGHLTIARRWTLDHAADAMAAGLRLGLLAPAPDRRPPTAGRSSRATRLGAGR